MDSGSFAIPKIEDQQSTIVHASVHRSNITNDGVRVHVGPPTRTVSDSSGER